MHRFSVLVRRGIRSVRVREFVCPGMDICATLRGALEGLGCRNRYPRPPLLDQGGWGNLYDGRRAALEIAAHVGRRRARKLLRREEAFYRRSQRRDLDRSYAAEIVAVGCLCRKSTCRPAYEFPADDLRFFKVSQGWGDVRKTRTVLVRRKNGEM